MGKDLKGKNLGDGITQRKDGRYCARYTDRYGKRRCLYSSSIRRLKEELRKAKESDSLELSINGAMTLDRWYENWISVYKYQVKATTKKSYDDLYRSYVSAKIGNILLTDITTLDIRRTINDIAPKGHLCPTKQGVRALLFDLFDKAVIDDFARRNPVIGVKVEKSAKREKKILSRDEQTRFFKACKDTFYEEMFTVAVLTGLRPGELFALREGDVDLFTNTIYVNNTLTYKALNGDGVTHYHMSSPKTEQSVRKVRFGKRCAEALRSQFKKKSMIAASAEADPIEGLEDILFVNKHCRPLEYSQYRSAIRSVVNKANRENRDEEPIRPFSGHCFRHIYATRCFEAGVAPKVVQKQLGHSSLKMTMDIYTHLFEDKRDEELYKLDAVSDAIFDGESSARDTRKLVSNWCQTG